MIYKLAAFHNKLGDNMQMTTLPVRLTEAGHSVYLLSDPQQEQVNAFSNEEIKKFVWGNNPWIKGDITGVWNCGDLPGTYANITNSFLGNWEAAHGLKAPYSTLPIIYHKPNPIKNIDGVIELSSITLKYQPEKVKSLVQQIIKAHPGYRFIQIVSDHQHNKIIINQNVLHYPIKSLFELWDILNSCKCFISLNSGTHSVAAAALRNNKTMVNYCILPENDYDWIMEQRKFVYDGCTYLKEGRGF